MIKRLQNILVIFTILCISADIHAQHSVARQWNEALLQAIRDDFARPTVHARNLFHSSAAMYDAWAAYDKNAETYLLGKTINGFTCPFLDIIPPLNIASAQKEAISYASFRLLSHRFKNSPNSSSTLANFRNLMINLGYDPNKTTLDYRNSPAGLGNYIAEFLINYGLEDGSNESNLYANTSYQPVNTALPPGSIGNPTIEDPNRWQPLEFFNFIDQSGNFSPHAIPEFVSPEWGQVYPFSMKPEDKTTYFKDGFNYQVYHDPGPPPNLGNDNESNEEYTWGFSLVAIWSSHLNVQDGIIWDISPSSMGNIDLRSIPESRSNYDQFYNYIEGNDTSQGYNLNPHTGAPYQPQLVKRGDYTRVLAEFWADGPDSETPPGHWFTILNYVNDQPNFEKRFKGEGLVLEDLEWDIKAYFLLGGAMHDAAIAAWGIKGFYDYIRPVSAIRYMADKGQSTDTDLPNYDPEGIPLVPGYIELISAEDPLVGNQQENINKIKIYGWKGPDSIVDPDTDAAGVDWILAENWWPYQRPTFITPPFAGYISGHSTYSRAAAEIMTLLTGDAFFPGGLGEFAAPKNEFLVFEEGPTEDIVLQWATYRDASDQCSLSRIWGGIHPPADDLPGRLIGEKIGIDAFNFGEKYFSGKTPINDTSGEDLAIIYPNPVGDQLNIKLNELSSNLQIEVIDITGKIIDRQIINTFNEDGPFQLQTDFLKQGVYILRLITDYREYSHRIIKR